MKNEPEDYSIEDLKRDKTEPWDGIRNYQVRNMIRDDMSVGDLAFFYHSNCDEPGILKLEDPNQEILPDNGLIVIFPAGRKHSVFYKGKKDRIIIGVNFYKI